MHTQALVPFAPRAPLAASERGTLVRVWDTRSGQRLMELRRGAEPAVIQCMCFHADNSWLLVGSDHGKRQPPSMARCGSDRWSGRGACPDGFTGHIQFLRACPATAP
eukprot:scaffold2431_cov116-Isochrysis_galbana.AAC.9